MSSSSCHVSFAFQSGSTTYAASRTQARGGGGGGGRKRDGFRSIPLSDTARVKFPSREPPIIRITNNPALWQRSAIQNQDDFSFWICCHSPSMRTDRGVTFSCDRERQSLPHRFNTAIFEHKSASPLLCGAFTVSSTVQFLIQDMIM